MADILFNNQGNPVFITGRTFKAEVNGTPAGKDYSKPSALQEKDEKDNKSSYQGLEVAMWGDGNNFPELALDEIGKTTVLNSGLRFIHNVVMGQGLFPCKVIDYDDRGNEVLQIVNNKELIKSLNSRMIRRYMSLTLRDKLKLGVACPEMVLSGDKIVGINPINTKHFRQTTDRTQAIISGEWPNNPTNDVSIIDILDLYDPEYNAIEKKAIGKNKNFIYPIKNEWDNNDIYTKPDWYVAKRAGWTELTNLTPAFLIKMFKNQISWVWHVKIPYTFWEKKFPKADYKDAAKRQSEIQTYLDDFEKKLIGVENANSALFTFYEINANGKAEEQWIIDPLQNKYKSEDNLFTTAAANSEILFSLLINPTVMGAGMPGGVYSGASGGSNIREAFLVNNALAWTEKQNLMDPIEFMYRYNGFIEDDVEIRFRNTILTTLDTGAGTSKILS